MARVILHLGMPKTGTTSIQYSLSEARATLAAQDIVYPDLGANHSVRIFDAFSEIPHRRHRRLGHDMAAIAERAERDRLYLREAFRANPGADFVISGEGIPRLSEEATQRLLGFLGGHFDRIEVVFLVRPPASFIHSQTQQLIKSGMTVARFARAPFGVPYRARYEKYFRLLPRDAIRARVFSRSTLVEGCAVATFLTLCGWTSLIGQVPVIRRNESISRPAADLLLVANEILPPTLPGGGRNPARDWRLSQVLSAVPGPKFRAPREAVLRGLEASRDDIAWLNDALGIRIEEYDEGLAAEHDFHPGRIAPADWAALEDRVREENRRLLMAGPPGGRRRAAEAARDGERRPGGAARRKMPRQRGEGDAAPASPSPAPAASRHLASGKDMAGKAWRQGGGGAGPGIGSGWRTAGPGRPVGGRPNGLKP